MTVPGSNLLNQAFTVIAQQTVNYYSNTGRTTNAIGFDISSYAAAALLKGSFQPVPRKLYQVYGLDLQKSYFTFYCSANVLDIARGVSGDQINFNGVRYQVESANDWFALDGWVGVLCVQVALSDA
jgi:hypothetical protein